MPNQSLMERLLALPGNMYDWLKFEVIIPLTERLILLVSPKSPLDRLIEDEQRAIKREFSNIIYSSDGTLKEEVICHRFEEYLNVVMDRNTDLSPTQRMKLICALRDELLSISLNNRYIDQVLLKRWTLRDDVLKEARHLIGGALNQIIAKYYQEIERIANQAENGCISGFLSQCHHDLNLSEANTIRLYNDFRSYYKHYTENMSCNPERFMRDAESPTIVPHAFNTDFHREGVTLSYPARDGRQPLELPIVEKSERKQKETALMEHLQEITGNNARAIYTICSHLNQFPKRATHYFFTRVLNQCLGLEFSLDRDHADIKTCIGVDEDNNNKIVIVQKLDIKHDIGHEENSDNNTSGPNSLRVTTEGRDSQYSSLSDYQERWIGMAMSIETRVTIDINNPEYALVELMDPFIHLP
ncbi:hypothetical protein GCM10023116_16540 [Kistimonas scapharcae]|uniref:Uncharacterized protein n=2 Tax=Kistimonas scapharcae TaxID=1036133 RepID=A0ABP8UZW2_9GAMM